MWIRTGYYVWKQNPLKVLILEATLKMLFYGKSSEYLYILIFISVKFKYKFVDHIKIVVYDLFSTKVLLCLVD